MKTIQKDGYVFSADTEKTKKHYESNTLCDCVACRNFDAQVRNAFPKLCEFLSLFGIDAEKPDEIFSAEAENGVDYMEVDYTVDGSVVEMETENIELSGLHISVSDGCVLPNEATERYFTLSVAGITLPRIIKASERKRTAKTRRALFRFGSLFRKTDGKADEKRHEPKSKSLRPRAKREN